jgi:hypothetical protein
MDAHAPYQNGVVVPYPIAYEPEILGGWFFNPGQNSMCIDHWGYANGAKSDTG